MRLPHEIPQEDLHQLEDQYNWIIKPSELEWKDPGKLGQQYQYILHERVQRLQKIRELSLSDLNQLKQFYRENKIQFIIDWAVTFDPRKVADKQAAIMPFVPFPKQLAALQFFGWCLDNREYGLLEKSRECGATWLAAAFSVSFWLFEPGFVAGFGSRKEIYVDQLNNPASIFWRIRKMLEYVPQEFMPGGFLERKHSLSMRIINPENGSAITGEAGDSIGRGDRTTIYFVDEAAFLERPLLIDASLSATTNCRVDISTSNGPGVPFYAKIVNGNHPIFTFHWTDDPRKDEDWYKQQKRKLDPVIVAQEIDIDHHAATDDNLISGKVVEEAMQQDASKLEPTGATYLSIDAAHMGDDKSVLTLRQGRVVFWVKKFRHKSGPELAQIAQDLADSHPWGVDQIAVELDGPGVSVHDHLKLGKYQDKTIGIHTGKKLNDGRNYNLRARMYRKLKEWLEDGPVSLPRDRDLQAQLGASPYGYKDGKLLLKSKREIKNTGFISPDEADSLAIGFAVECNDFAQMGWKPEEQDMYHIPKAVSPFATGRVR